MKNRRLFALVLCLPAFVGVVERRQIYCSTCWRVCFDLNGREMPRDNGRTLGDQLDRFEVNVSGGWVFVLYEEVGHRAD